MTSIRSDSLNNLITIESPPGKALLKHKVGEKVKVTVNDNVSYFVTIVTIENNKNDSEDKISSY